MILRYYRNLLSGKYSDGPNPSDEWFKQGKMVTIYNHFSYISSFYPMFFVVVIIRLKLIQFLELVKRLKIPFLG